MRNSLLRSNGLLWERNKTERDGGRPSCGKLKPTRKSASVLGMPLNSPLPQTSDLGADRGDVFSPAGAITKLLMKNRLLRSNSMA